MSIGEPKLTLAFRKNTASLQKYRVVKAENTTTHDVGDWLTKRQVEGLIPYVRVTIVEAK